MITQLPEFKKARKLSHNSFIGNRYVSKCPYCKDENLIWESEYKARKLRHPGTNVCQHFYKLFKNGIHRRT